MFEWFDKARYGALIVYGPYSVAARGEWVMNRETIPLDEYTELYVNNFHAEHYNPDDWMEKAKKWGMGYTILTTRFVDGFCMWDSAVNPFNAKRLGPKRDLVAEYVAAVRKAGLKLGFYYCTSNWAHPDYPGPFFRDWPQECDWKSEASRKRFIAYYRAELKELLTKYGKVDYLWFDGPFPAGLEGDETVRMVRELQPGIMINNRLGEPYDVKISEQVIEPTKDASRWEASMTLNQNWGYHAGDHHWKSPKDVLFLLLRCAEAAGNLHIGIGPRADGSIQEETDSILSEVAGWLKVNRRSIECTQRHKFTWTNTARPITRVGNTAFLHFIADPGDTFCWADLASPVAKAYWLDSGETVQVRQSGNRTWFSGLKHNGSLCRTLVVEVKGELKSNFPPTCGWLPG